MINTEDMKKSQGKIGEVADFDVENGIQNELTMIPMEHELKFTSFKNAKNELQSFSQRTMSDFGLDYVPTSGGLFGLGEHKVTGNELNNIVSQIQDYLITLQGVNTDVIKAVGQVYIALESLDGQYIPAILSAVKGAELASNQAQKAIDNARKAQEEISEAVRNQKQMIKVLENHKDKLDKLKHLENVDEIWRSLQSLEKKSRDNLKDINKKLSSLEKSIKTLQRFADSILDYEHIEDVDEIWDRVCTAEESISKSRSDIEDIHAAMHGFEHAIENLQKSVNQINSYEHLPEIDEMWDNIETCKEDIDAMYEQQKEIDSSVTGLKQDSAELKEAVTKEIEKRKEDVCALSDILEEEKSIHQTAIERLKRKLVIAYSVAGVAMGLGIIDLILNILGIF